MALTQSLDAIEEAIERHIASDGELDRLAKALRGVRGVGPNTPEALAAWIARARPALVGMEPTGGYERALCSALAEAGVRHVKLHPNTILAFRKARGLRAKTDPSTIPARSGRVASRAGAGAGENLRSPRWPPERRSAAPHAQTSGWPASADAPASNGLFRYRSGRAAAGRRAAAGACGEDRSPRLAGAHKVARRLMRRIGRPPPVSSPAR